jgi:hypothetical protein
MKIQFLIFALFLILASCSSTKPVSNISIATASSGIVKNPNIPFNLYLTDKIEPREELASKAGNNAIIVHTGHILKSALSKAENEKILESLNGSGFDAINLTIEDFIIADKKGISFEAYPSLTFLNSSVVDLNEDNIISKSNIKPYILREDVALIGISDKVIDGTLSVEKFLVSDYVLAILRAKKAASKEVSAISTASENKTLNSFLIVHTIGEDINEVMSRLPPTFINSLAD